MEGGINFAFCIAEVKFLGSVNGEHLLITRSFRQAENK